MKKIFQRLVRGQIINITWTKVSYRLASAGDALPFLLTRDVTCIRSIDITAIVLCPFPMMQIFLYDVNNIWKILQIHHFKYYLSLYMIYPMKNCWKCKFLPCSTWLDKKKKKLKISLLSLCAEITYMIFFFYFIMQLSLIQMSIFSLQIHMITSSMFCSIFQYT